MAGDQALERVTIAATHTLDELEGGLEPSGVSSASRGR